MNIGTIGHIDHGKTALTAALIHLLGQKKDDPLPAVAPQSDRDAFMNAVRILYSMEPDLPRGDYDRFIDSPCEFLMTADEPTLAKIWDAVQARQPARYRQ
jgi:hypothetical protein